MAIPRLNIRKKRPIKFTYPNGRVVLFELKDEFKILMRRPNGDYYFHIQRVYNPNTNEFNIRFGYYRKEHGERAKSWRWGSQTAMMLPEDICVKLFTRGRSKEWWRRLLNKCAD